MGSFTMYCIICSGPGENFYDNYNDNDDEYHENEDTAWLNRVQAIHKNGITEEGSYNSLGSIEINGDDNFYSLCPSIWNTSDDYDLIPSMLVHTICLSMLKKYIKDFNERKFFNIFKDHLLFYGIIRDIDYQGIENNIGQNYQLIGDEEYYLENPDIIKNIDLEINIIKKDTYIIPKFLSNEIQNIIFEYLDYKPLCNISNVCYYWYKLSRMDKYWISIIKDRYDFHEIDNNCNNVKELFKIYFLDLRMEDKIKNRKRIIECINQINIIYQNHNNIE